MKKIERCLFQVGRPSNLAKALFNHEEKRDCDNCTYDPENNKRCPDYVGIHVYEFDVTDRRK